MTLREPSFFILTALAGQAAHGYAIIQSVQALSDGRVTLRASTLYAALDRLSDDGLIAIDREEIVEGRLRRYYRLTDDGSGLLASEVTRLRHNATVAAERLRRIGALGTATTHITTAGAR